MIEWYQHLPEHINPLVFVCGFFSLSWYALAYLSAIGVGGLLLYRHTREILSSDQYIDLLFNIVTGMLVGSRLGYVLLYNFPYYAAHPMAIVWPFDIQTGAWIGIAGMSYYGGFVGVVVGMWLFARRTDYTQGVPTIAERFWYVADAMASSLPAGYFFGRVGNFVNGELYGRVTEKMWGMYFPSAPFGDVILRHPSQLYEAFFEGVVLFGIVLLVRKFQTFSGAVASAYMIGYSFFRFGIEFFREPDPQIGFIFGWLTLGQIIAIVVFVIGTILFFWLKGKKYDRL